MQNNYLGKTTEIKQHIHPVLTHINLTEQSHNEIYNTINKNMNFITKFHN